jgi:predicted enzyme related to lactoylglutathione lyase
MAKVVGIGGVFVKARDPKALAAWYRDELGIDVKSWGGAKMSNDAGTYSVWTAFADTTDHFKPSDKPFMINLRVDDLDALLARLREHGARVLDERRESSPFGEFGYVVDPEGTLLELFQPAPST